MIWIGYSCTAVGVLDTLLTCVPTTPAYRYVMKWPWGEELAGRDEDAVELAVTGLVCMLVCRTDARAKTVT